MSDITYELKISPDKNSKQALLEFLLEQGRSDWVDCYDDLDIDDADLIRLSKSSSKPNV